MTPIPDHGNGSVVPFVGLPCPNGFEACWAGEYSAPDPEVPPLICVGSLDGKLLFVDQEFKLLIPANGPASGSEEAINGVAQIGTWVAVSTRNEVSFWRMKNGQGGFAPLGAHGVSATPSGYFVAPAGHAGILTAKPSETGISLNAHLPGGGKLYIYRALPLRSHSGKDVLVCAARLAGIAAGIFSVTAAGNPMKTASFKDVDIIDLCALSQEGDSLAVAALGRDGSVILYQDILNDTKPKTFRFQTMKGVAYRILSHRGDVYVLTSCGLYVLGKLGNRFLSGEKRDEIVTPILPLPFTAVDMNLAWGRWLLIVVGNEVRKFDLDMIHDFVPQNIGHGEIKEFPTIPSEVEPEWSNVSSETTLLASA